jgi:hypothetical protein
MNSSSTLTLTVPADSEYNFLVGTQIVVLQLGIGQINIVGQAGVSVFSEGARTITKARYAVASLIKINPNQWILTGNLVI